MAGPILLSGAEDTMRSKIIANIEYGNISWNTISDFRANMPKVEELGNRIKTVEELRKEYENDWNNLVKKVNKTIKNIDSEAEVPDLKYGPGEITKVDDAVNAIYEKYKGKKLDVEKAEQEYNKAKAALAQVENDEQSAENTQLVHKSENWKNAKENLDNAEKKFNEAKGAKRFSELKEELDKYKLALNDADRQINQLSDTEKRLNYKKNKIASVNNIIGAIEKEKIVKEVDGRVWGETLNVNTDETTAKNNLEKYLEWSGETNNQSQTVSSPNQNTSPYVNRNANINIAQSFTPNRFLGDTIIFSSDNNVPVRTNEKSYGNVKFQYPSDWSMETDGEGFDVLKDSQGNEVAKITKGSKGEIQNINMNFENGGSVIVNGKPLNIPAGSEMTMKITSKGVECEVTNNGRSIMNGKIDKNGEYVGPHNDQLPVNRPRQTHDQPFSSPDSTFRQSQYLNPARHKENVNISESEIYTIRTINKNPDTEASKNVTTQSY